MITVAITGGIGSGKSLVSSILREKGFVVLDCDALSREVCCPGSPLLEFLAGFMGPEIIKEDGSMDRARVAEIAFSDAEKYRRMNSLIQTAIKLRLFQQIRDAKKEGSLDVIFAEVPLLFEAGWQKEFDRSWLVAAEEGIRIARVQKRSGLSEEQIRARMAKQLPQEKKAALADLIIDNSSDVEALKAEIARALETLL